MKTKKRFTDEEIRAMMQEDGTYSTQDLIPAYFDPNFQFDPERPLRGRGELDHRDAVEFHRLAIAQISENSFIALEEALRRDRLDREWNKRAGKGFVSSLKWEESASIGPDDMVRIEPAPQPKVVPLFLKNHGSDANYANESCD